ncbi:MAG: hypothetical protein KQH57_07755 [Actinomycetales bacterium]|nr:hypothetical protein [Actinomycetales bacterium]
MSSPEARLYRASWADGSLDLVAGAAVIVIGAGYWTDLVVASIVVPPLALVAWQVLHRRVVEPRAGRVEFRRERRERSRRELGWSVGLGVAALVAVLAVLGAGVAARGAFPGDLVDALPATLLAVLAVVAAGLTRSPRFAWYGALLLAAGAGAVLTGTGPGLTLVLAGAVVAATGAVLLARLVADAREDEA